MKFKVMNKQQHISYYSIGDWVRGEDESSETRDGTARINFSIFDASQKSLYSRPAGVGGDDATRQSTARRERSVECLQSAGLVRK